MTKRPRLIVVSVLAFSVLVGLAAYCVKPELFGAAQLQRQVQVPPVGAFSPVVIAYVTLGDVVVQKCRVVSGAEPPTRLRRFMRTTIGFRILPSTSSTGQTSPSFS